MSGKRTYWHLAGLGRRPTDYDVAGTRLLYYPGRGGFEVEVPATAWYAAHQQGSPLRCADWEAFRDPRETTYAAYTARQADQETFVDGALRAAEEGGGDAALASAWVADAAGLLGPLRFAIHGLQMLSAYVAHMAPAGRIVTAGLFQTADEVRRIQRYAYRLRQLHDLGAPVGDAGRGAWQVDDRWQPLRALIERLLVTWDWAEAHVALNAALKPRLDALLGPGLAELARRHGDEALAQLAFSLHDDARWHQAWSEALLGMAAAAEPTNRAVLDGWLARWGPEAEAAVAPLAAHLRALAAGEAGLAR